MTLNHPNNTRNEFLASELYEQVVQHSLFYGHFSYVVCRQEASIINGIKKYCDIWLSTN